MSELSTLHILKAVFSKGSTSLKQACSQDLKQRACLMFA